MDEEFVTTYRGVTVPPWVLENEFEEASIPGAFKAGVDAALPTGGDGPPWFKYSTEPPRDGQYVDQDGDVWTYDTGWSYCDRTRRTWSEVTHDFTDIFPWESA